MKLSSTLTILGSFLTVLTQAKKSSNLRDSRISILSEVPSRNLQTGRTNPSNAALINEAIAASLPTINGLIQAAIPDPYEVGESAELTFTASGTPCDTQIITATITLDIITGQNTTELTSLTIIEGTESVSCGCPTSFSGQFNFVGGATSYALSGPVALMGEMGSCDASVDGTYTATMMDPTWTGTITLSGTIDGDTVSIDSSSVDELDITVGTTAVALSGLPAEYDNYVAEIQALIQAKVTTYVAGSDFNQVIIDAINAGIQATILSWGWATSSSYILRFAGANLGNTVGAFFGFGK